jgi:hypothetical protein
MRSKRLSLVAAALALAAVVAVITGALSSPSPMGTAGALREAKYTGSVTVDTSGAVEGTLEDNYIGLSFGTNELNTAQLDNVGNLTTVLRNLGTGVIRFGGIVADENFTGITSKALAGLARLTKASGWSVLYTENIGQFNASNVAASAEAVSEALGSGLAAFACGNEPEFFYNDGVRPKSYSVGDYLGDTANCIEAIDAGAPNAPIEGPDTVTEPTWPAAYASTEAGMIKYFGAHFYPLPCGLDGETPAERATQLFSQSQIAREIWWFDWAKKDADTAKADLWMDEVNTACGGGDPGLSDTFASALWIVDYLLIGAERGASGMDIEGGLGSCKEYQVSYSPLCEVSTNEYVALPIYYGMLFTHLLGTGSLLPVTVSGGTSAGDVAAFALRSSTGNINVIIENFSKTQAVIKLSVPGISSNASVLHLTAPSLLATSGVNIQGATVSANGVLQPGKANLVQCSAGECPITVAPDSAELINLSK